ncbi:PP2C family protein-serine/threonine phosphatase [Adlercreutzia sp. ZJ141]|uniref:PP2C family protein-serine/threonine phosphatase n=1 Tax=Adlercreutzia sp. ZJ141 TaxID=2709406 RepID=UPI0013EE3D50|nr:protein phosphatase 2C domain-containing protein [Adlercreutzia sp. ZJ141]
MADNEALLIEIGSRKSDATNECSWLCEAACAIYLGERDRQEDAAFLGDAAIYARKQNSFCSVMREKRYEIPSVFAVADGMGGHNAGEEASDICIANIAKYAKTLSKAKSIQSVAEGMQRAITCASKEMEEAGHADAKKKDMGATLVSFAVCDDGCAVLNIGNSRAYIQHDRKLQMLSRDDTEGQRFLDLNLLEQSEVARHPDKNRLTQYVGKAEPGLIIRAHVRLFDLESQTILLCTDGITDTLSEREIGELLESGESLTQQCQIIADRAIAGGGTDNMTVLLVRIDRCKHE